MTSKQNKIDQLAAFRKRGKFSDQAWDKRGLNPGRTYSNDKQNSKSIGTRPNESSVSRIF